LSWFKKSHELKSIGGTWHHQANYSTAQVVAQLPNAAQLSIKVQKGMMGIWWFNLDLAFKFFIFHAKKPLYTTLLLCKSTNLPSKLVAHGLQGMLLTTCASSPTSLLHPLTVVSELLVDV
jgi:hypothetical protein